MSKKILITGAGGLIGNHLILELLTDNENEIFLYCRNKEKMQSILSNNILFENINTQNIQITEGDITDNIKVYEAIEGKDEVYHCAAVVSFWQKNFTSMMQTNVEGTANIVNACLEHRIKKLCFVSSIAALGRSLPGKMINEENDWEESKYNSQYAISKMLSEREVWRGTEEGLDAVIINPGVILGEGDWNNSSNKIFKQLSHGMPFYPQGINGFVDVKDVVKMMVKLMNSDVKNDRFIAVSANLSFYELFKTIAETFGKTPPKYKVGSFLAWLGAFVYDIKSRFDGKDPLLTYETARNSKADFKYDGKKLTQKTGIDYTPIEETLKRVCQFYATNYVNKN